MCALVCLLFSPGSLSTLFISGVVFSFFPQVVLLSFQVFATSPAGGGGPQSFFFSFFFFFVFLFFFFFFPEMSQLVFLFRAFMFASQ